MILHPEYKDLLINKSHEGEGFYSQTKVPGLTLRPRNEHISEGDLFASPSSLLTGPQKKIATTTFTVSCSTINLPI